MVFTAERKIIAALIKAYKSGDKTAFKKLYELTIEQATYIASGILTKKEDIEDVVQDSYLAAIEKIDELRDETKFLSWFYQIVTNKSLNYLDKSRTILQKTSLNAQNILIHSLAEDQEILPAEVAEENELKV